jgi:hypothetical protein
MARRSAAGLKQIQIAAYPSTHDTIVIGTIRGRLHLLKSLGPATDDDSGLGRELPVPSCVETRYSLFFPFYVPRHCGCATLRLC